MRTISKLASFVAAVAFLLPVGCTVEKSEMGGSVEKSKAVHFLAGFDKSGKTKAQKAPRFSEWKAKRSILFDAKMDGGMYATTTLPVGTFEASDEVMDMYATLATNGLVSVFNRAIYNADEERYTNWITVAMAPAGEKYLHKYAVKDCTRPLVKPAFDSLYYNPVRNMDEYGRIKEDPAIEPAARTLLDNFYKAYIVDEPDAISKYCDSEFIEAYNRLAKITEYRADLGYTTVLNDHAFTGGVRRASAAFEYYKIAKYKNTYRVKFKSGKSVLVILSDSHDTIFDLVFKESSNSTVRTENAAVKDETIKNYTKLLAERKKNKVPAAVPVKEREWYAPGLEINKVSGPTEYEIAQKNSVVNYVVVDLYCLEVEKIHKVVVNNSGTEDEPEYNASATVIFKKDKLTPFQFILQKYGEVEAVRDDNLYESREFGFRYYDDCGWTLNN